MRVWIQKQKKKEEAKTASQAPATPAETTPAAPEAQAAGDIADKPVGSNEDAPKTEGADGGDPTAENSGDAAQPTEVGLRHFSLLSHSPRGAWNTGSRTECTFSLPSRNEHDFRACASDDRMQLHSLAVLTNAQQDAVAPKSEEAERRGSIASQQAAKSVEPSTTDAPTDEQANASGPKGAMMPNNAMMMNGMSGQMGFGFSNQAGFNNGMGYGVNNMNGMSNMMGSGNWSGMNSMGKSTQTPLG